MLNIFPCVVPQRAKEITLIKSWMIPFLSFLPLIHSLNVSVPLNPVSSFSSTDSPVITHILVPKFVLIAKITLLTSDKYKHHCIFLLRCCKNIKNPHSAIYTSPLVHCHQCSYYFSFQQMEHHRLLDMIRTLASTFNLFLCLMSNQKIFWDLQFKTILDLCIFLHHSILVSELP